MRPTHRFEDLFAVIRGYRGIIVGEEKAVLNEFSFFGLNVYLYLHSLSAASAFNSFHPCTVLW